MFRGFHWQVSNSRNPTARDVGNQQPCDEPFRDGTDWELTRCHPAVRSWSRCSAPTRRAGGGFSRRQWFRAGQGIGIIQTARTTRLDEHRHEHHHLRRRRDGNRCPGALSGPAAPTPRRNEQLPPHRPVRRRLPPGLALRRSRDHPDWRGTVHLPGSRDGHQGPARARPADCLRR